LFYHQPDSRATTVPHHGNRDIAPSLLHKTLAEIWTPLEAFLVTRNNDLMRQNPGDHWRGGAPHIEE
jgi:hypothetical protein